jgi:hypothetical protein
MTCFEELFKKSKGQPIVYEGKVLQMVDRLEFTREVQMKVVFESSNAEWRQGVHLSTDGTFEVNGQSIKKGFVLWVDTAPPEVSVRVKSKKGECWIKNVWDTGNGSMESWHNGAAMIVEKSENVRKYRCNDGKPDEDFDDLVFRIEGHFADKK